MWHHLLCGQGQLSIINKPQFLHLFHGANNCISPRFAGEAKGHEEIPVPGMWYMFASIMIMITDLFTSIMTCMLCFL